MEAPHPSHCGGFQFEVIIAIMERNRALSCLQDYFSRQCKPDGEHLTGVEFELFALNEKGHSISFSGENGIETFLTALSQAADFWQRSQIIENRLLSIQSEAGTITLEPASQIEFSSHPRKNLFELQNDWNLYINSLKAHLKPFDFDLFGVGVHPFQEPNDLELLPKPRYHIMDKHFQNTGSLGRWMMRCSSSTQVTCDYNSLEDLFKKIYLSLKIAPFAQALFANSPFWKGKQSDYLCLRGLIWSDTDSKRSGIPIDLFKSDLNLETLSNALLSTPAIFYQHKENYHYAEGKNFYEIHEGDFESDEDLFQAIDLHINQIFTETRVKNYLEFRTTDTQIPRFQMSVPAFYKGIFGDSKAVDETSNLLDEFNTEDILNLHTIVCREALQTPLRNYYVIDIVKSLLEIAAKGLDRQATLQSLSRSEQIFLHPIMEIVFENSYCPAQYFLRAYEKDFNQSLHHALKISKY